MEQHGVVEGALGWESLVLTWARGRNLGFEDRDSPAVWLFILLSLSCFISKMGVVSIPTSWVVGKY